MSGTEVVVGIGIFFLCAFLFGGAAVLTWGSVHVHQFWCLGFHPVLLLVAFISPALCFGYNTVLPSEWNGTVRSWKNAKMFGFTFQVSFLALCWWCVPLIVWWNLGGDAMLPLVITAQLSTTLFVFSYVLWLKIFILSNGAAGSATDFYNDD